MVKKMPTKMPKVFLCTHKLHKLWLKPHLGILITFHVPKHTLNMGQNFVQSTYEVGTLKITYYKNSDQLKLSKQIKLQKN
jgi:hypothetical protein